MLSEKLKSSKKLRVIAIILAVILVASAAVGIALALRLRLPKDATVCNMNVSDMLVKDAYALIDENVRTYAFNVATDDQSFQIDGSEFDVTFLSDDFENVVRASVETVTAIDPHSVVSVNKSKIQSYFEANFDQQHKDAVPATVVWDDAADHFKVIPGTPENWYDSGVLAETVYNAIFDLPAELTISNDALYTERADVEQLEMCQAMAARANELLDLQIEYVFNPRQVELGRVTIDRAMIASLIRFDYENGTVYADEAATLTYVESIAPEYRYFQYKDRFITHGGVRIDVKIDIQEQLVDTTALTNSIVENIGNGVSGTFDVPYIGQLNFDGSYIELSIPEQHLWVYQDGVVVLETDVITGNESRNKRTPRGLNIVRGHLQSIYLVDDYFVDYWMCISMDGNYGFHDAYRWRSDDEYGGDTYKTNGSGGCVNVPLEKMALMYEMVPDYTPIVIYDSHYLD